MTTALHPAAFTDVAGGGGDATGSGSAESCPQVSQKRPLTSAPHAGQAFAAGDGGVGVAVAVPIGDPHTSQ
jgi:hypothetical protein